MTEVIATAAVFATFFAALVCIVFSRLRPTATRVGLIDCLGDQILWDEDWKMLELRDADPQQSQAMKENLGIDDDYFVWVPPDPTDDEAARIVKELRYLTNRLGELPPA